jgi:recombination protein RecA
MKAQDLANELNARLGGSTIRMGSDADFTVEYLPTTILPIDVLLGGGIPRGRFTEIFGDFSTLKSLIAYKTIANVQRRGGRAVLVDSEHSFDPVWANYLGINVGSLLIQRPATAEEAADATQVAASDGYDIVVWDSIASLLPQAEAGKRMSGENMQPARLAAFMSAALRKITSSNANTALLFINQTRINVAQMFGSTEAVPGGKALPFYASYRVALRKAGKIHRERHTVQGGKSVKVRDVVGYNIRATLEKSKLSAPHKDVLFTFDLQNAEVDEVGFLFDLGIEHGRIKKKGTQQWQMGSTTIRGSEKFLGWLRSSPKAQAELRRLVSVGNAPAAKRKVVVKKRSS